jgi:hypothetical protein
MLVFLSSFSVIKFQAFRSTTCIVASGVEEFQAHGLSLAAGNLKSGGNRGISRSGQAP